MSLVSWLRDRWSRASVPYSYVAIDPARVELNDGRALDVTPITDGMRYYRVWLSEMALQDDRQWFSDWHPAVYAATRFLLDGKDQVLNVVAGPSVLTDLSKASLTKSVALNYPLTPLLPYNGGDVEIEAGLAAIQGTNDLSTLLDVVSRFSKLLNVPQFSAALSLVEPIAGGITGLFGDDRAKPVLRVHNTFTSGDGAGANQLRGGYIAVLAAPAGSVPDDELWVIRDRLYRGATRQGAQPIAGVHYMLLRLESTATRSDWSALTSIAEPYTQAMQSLVSSVYALTPTQREAFMEQAEQRLGAAQFAAVTAKELTRIVGRTQVAQAIRAAFEESKRTLGQGAVPADTPTTLEKAMAFAPSVEAVAAEAGLSARAEPTSPPGLDVAGSLPVSALERDVRIPPNWPLDPTPSRSTQRVERTPHMDVAGAEPLAPGTPFTVTVYVDQQAPRPGEATTDIAVNVPSGLAAIDLDVWLAGTAHFDFDGARDGRVRIALQAGETETRATFSVTVVPDPPATPAQLTAYFSYEGRPCGQVTRLVGVSAAAGVGTPTAPSDVVPAVLRVDAGAAKPDLTIVVTDPAGDGQHLQCRVTTPHLPGFDDQPRGWTLPQNAGALVIGLMGEFVKPGASNKARLLSLRGAGLKLWQAAPDAVKRAYWQLVDGGHPLDTILIVSAEPYFPWELAMPTRTKDGVTTPRGALGVEHAVGRWTPGNNLAPPQQVPLTRSIVIAPDYPGPTPKPLEHALDEAERVLGKVPGTMVTPSDFDRVTSAFAEPGYTLLHVVCHGVDSGQTGLQKIYLEGPGGQTEELTSNQVDGLFPERRGLGHTPLVFLNACEVGRATAALVGIGGFAQAFIDAGAGAVVAPLWSIKDKLAPEVSAAFYDAVMKDPTTRFADVLRGIRSRAYAQDGGEDTFAAYCFYGDPCAARAPKVDR